MGVLKASKRNLGGVLEASWSLLGSFFGLGHGIAFSVDFEMDFQQYERLVLIGFKDETWQPYIVLCISV